MTIAKEGPYLRTNMDDLIMHKEKGSAVTKLSKNKVVIEVDNALETVTFWETKYTYRHIVELVHSIPDLIAQINSYNFKDEI